VLKKPRPAASGTDRAQEEPSVRTAMYGLADVGLACSRLREVP